LVLTPDEDFETAFFGKIFYATEKRNWLWRQKFEAKYANVSRFITSLKAESHKDLPRELTRRESHIMLDGVAAKRLDAGATFYSLHDAIYSAQKDLPLVEKLIREEFALHGVGVTIKQRVTQPVAAAPVVSFAPSDDELIARLEAQFASLDNDFDPKMEAVAVADDNFWA
jgi:hypothetical protein